MVARHLLTLTLPSLSLKPRLRRLLLIFAVVLVGLAVAWLPLQAVAFLLGGGVLACLLLLNPVLSLYVLIPTIPFSPLLAVSVGNFKIGGMEIILGLGLVAWLLQLATRSSGFHPAPPAQPDFTPVSRTKAKLPLLIPFLIFLGGISLSWLNSLSIGASLVETVKWGEMLALYIFVVTLLPARHIRWVVAILLMAGAAQALLGLYQFVFKVGPAGFLLFGGRFLRAYGTFAQPNPYAGYLGLGLPLALALMVWSLDRLLHPQNTPGSNSRPPAAIFYALASIFLFGLLLAALFATQSRGAWLGFAVAAALTLTFYSKRAALAMAALALAGALVALAGTFGPLLLRSETMGPGDVYSIITQRFIEAISIANIGDIATVEVNDANFATIERLAHWQAAQEMWRDHPWLGVGFGNYEVIYPAYAVGRWLSSLGHAHNYLLNIGAEAGLIGLVAYLILWIFAFKITWGAVSGNGGFERAVATGGLGILAHLHVHNFFDNLYVQGMYLHIAVILAIISILYLNSPQVSSRRENAWPGLPPPNKRNRIEGKRVN